MLMHPAQSYWLCQHVQYIAYKKSFKPAISAAVVGIERMVHTKLSTAREAAECQHFCELDQAGHNPLHLQIAFCEPDQHRNVDHI